jgi:dihydrofolate synthase/folylpolyglutamate synthase
MNLNQQYEEIVAYLYAQLPMFHRIGAAAYKADLKNTIALLDAVGNPQLKWPAIHIAGTNGKGSSSHLIAAALQANGYKTGLYTSPHLLDFRERIRINGVMIPKQLVVEFITSIKPTIEIIQPSFFELTVALSFYFFAKENVDIAVIETGLGGRLDSTNVVLPLACLITNISFDHMALLGNTLALIAGEKAGIIKPTIPIVISEHSTVDNVFIQKADLENAPIHFAKDVIQTTDLGLTSNLKRSIQIDHCLPWPEWNHKVLNLDLTGAYQAKNLIGVLQTLAIINQLGFSLQFTKTQDALEQAKKLTGLRGRWEVLAQQPLMIADIAHNVAGITELIQQLASFKAIKKHIVFGAVKDKDIASILKLLPQDAIYYWCAPDLPRALPVNDLTEMAKLLARNGTAFESVKLAVEAAQRDAQSADIIVITGSNFVVAEAL